MLKIRSYTLSLATVLLTAACATPSHESAEQTRSDAIATERLYAALNADPMYYYGHVKVRVSDGTAHLSGYVWSTDELYHAQRIASSVPGVHGVVDEMELERAYRR
jgi:osmotically-inducible protein OsmY